MSPYQHGEVFVTDDGAETDLDLGHYERFTGVPAGRADSVTAGRVLLDVLSAERRGDFLGGTVQVVPHVTGAIKTAMRDGIDADDAPDFTIVEIGGTVGDIEGQPFLEAARQLLLELGHERVAFLHLTYLPWIAAAGELKTKPTQHSVRDLRAAGIAPDVLLLRAEREIPEEHAAKIAMFCNVARDRVVNGPDVPNIYAAPERYHAAGLDGAILSKFGIKAREPDLRRWNEYVRRTEQPEWSVRIAVVGKYVKLRDAYKSLAEALAHAGVANAAAVEIDWIEGEDMETADVSARLSEADGIIVPGGFGSRGVEGKIAAISYARDREVPFLGICLGMQLAAIEAARRAGLPEPGSTEFGRCLSPVVSRMEEWSLADGTKETRSADAAIGGTLRLGSHPAILVPHSRSAIAYGTTAIAERHRHRYEVDPSYAPVLASDGLIVTGNSPDGKLPEIMERPSHPWFVAVQFHPELKSGPLAPHPLFVGLVAAAIRKSRLV
jgi:CTP synthase